MIFTILTILTIIWIFSFFYSKSKPNPPLPPGPKGFPIVGNLLSLQPELHTYFATQAQNYGPIFTLTLGTKTAIVITSPSLAKQVLRDQDVIFANRDVPVTAKILNYGGADIAWTPYGPEWRLLRKVCVKDLLSPSALDSVQTLRFQEMRHTVRFLAGKAGTRVNIGEQMFLTVMNVVTGMLWGGSLKEGDEREAIGQEFKSLVGEMTGVLGSPNFSDFFPLLKGLDLQGLQRKAKDLAKKMDRVFEKVIDQRLRLSGGEQGQQDFLKVMLELKGKYEEGDENKDTSKDRVVFSMTHLKALLMDMVVGGTDTSSNTAEFAIAEILKNQEILRNVQQELDTVVGKDNIVEEHHINKLPYLLAVMKETLRLHPILPLLVPHCPSESTVVGGYTIPKGSRIFINVWAIHRDPSIWPNPLEFDPERFLNAKFDFSGNDLNYFPFGSGRRICAGIAMAERTVLLSLATFLHSFDFQLPEEEKLDVEEKFGIVLSKRKPLVVIPQPRLRNPALYD